MNHRFLVTGASGFIGRFLCAQLLEQGWTVHGTLRPSKPVSALAYGTKPAFVKTCGPDADWTRALDSVDTVIHLAARVHVLHETSSDPLTEFRQINREGVRVLAEQAVVAGVRRFVFLSTIGVNGNDSGSSVFTENDEPRPHNPYAVSKYEAEQVLWKIAKQSNMDAVVIRAPLVYGPGNPGNFDSLLRIVSRGIPLPLSSVRNMRSLVFVRNLIDALECCSTHHEAKGKTYLVSDGEDVSTPELVRRVASALGKQASLFPFPPHFLRIVGAVIGKADLADRLVGSLRVDGARIRRELGWAPPFSLEQGLLETAKSFRAQSRQ